MLAARLDWQRSFVAVTALCFHHGRVCVLAQSKEMLQAKVPEGVMDRSDRNGPFDTPEPSSYHGLHPCRKQFESPPLLSPPESCLDDAPCTNPRVSEILSTPLGVAQYLAKYLLHIP